MKTNNFSEYFIVENSLFKGDIILVKLRLPIMKDRFLMYLGRDEVENLPVFAFHSFNGIEIINKNEIDKFLLNVNPIKIERFIGKNKTRQKMIENVFFNKKNSNYHLLIDNARFFKNFKNINKYSILINGKIRTRN